MISSLLRSLADAGFGSLAVVLRNGEELPDDLSGTDLDVSVLPGAGPADVVRLVDEVGRASGWMMVLENSRRHIAGASLHHPATGTSAHFDVFDGVTAYGMPLLTPADLADETVLQGGFSVLTGRGETLVTLLHHLSWNGRLGKRKYVDDALAVLADDGAWLRVRLEAVWGADASEAVLADLVAGRLTESGSSSRRRRRRLLAARAQRLGWGRAVRSYGSYLGAQAESLRRPAGVVATPGARLPSGLEVTAELACDVAPHSLAAPSVRSASANVENRNGERYVSSVRSTWDRWRIIRWVTPSAFLWYLAKRGRIVILDEVPALIRVGQRRGWPWVAR